MIAEPLSIVIVDDSDDIRALMRFTLEGDGRFRIVAEAENGKEAVRAADEHQPEAMLLDLRMPVMDGKTALRLIKAASPETAIVVYSAFVADDEIDELRSLGASDVLPKTTALERVCDQLVAAVRGDTTTV